MKKTQNSICRSPMELGWLSAKESKGIYTICNQTGTAIKKDGLLQPNFPLKKVIIPLGFAPSKNFFSEKKKMN